MVFCKSAAEYERELHKRMALFFQNVKPKEQKINKYYDTALDNETDVCKWIALERKREKKIGDLYRKKNKIIDDFVKSQPEKPVYIFRANRKYYKLKIDWVTGEYTKLHTPITGSQLLLLQRQKPGWIIEYTFPGSAFDIAICPNCKKEFYRHKPNEKFCPFCRRSPRSKRPRIIQQKTRYCQNPGCEKPIPTWKNNRAKYCSNACKTAAYEKRKITASSLSSVIL